jgi:hypothetical protein
MNDPPIFFFTSQLQLIFEIRQDIVDIKFCQEQMEAKITTLSNQLMDQQKNINLPDWNMPPPRHNDSTTPYDQGFLVMLKFFSSRLCTFLY